MELKELVEELKQKRRALRKEFGLPRGLKFEGAYNPDFNAGGFVPQPSRDPNLPLPTQKEIDDLVSSL